MSNTNGSMDAEMLERVDAAVSALSTDLACFASDLVAVPSVPGNEGPAQDIVRRKLESLGLSVETIDAESVAGLRDHPEYVEPDSSYDDRPNLVATREGNGNGRSLLFNGHVDVVPEGDRDAWSFDPFCGTIEDGNLLGRGASDMKGGVAAMIFALEALENAGIHLLGDLSINTVIEEEYGGSGGTLASVLAGVDADAVVIPEPTDFDQWIANDGVSYFRVTTEGKSAHAAETDSGVNAVSKLLPIYHALEELHDKRKTTVHDDLFEEWHEHTVSLNLGTIRGGEWISSVPDEATLQARISHAPAETREEIHDAVEAAVESATVGDPWYDDHPPEVEWFGWRGSSANIDPGEPIVQTVRSVTSSVLCRDSHPQGFPGGIDSRFFINENGTPATCFGPGAYNIHGTDEYLPVDELEEITLALAVIAMEWCGYEVRDAE
ncbi:ArgE/DapE family deacylase [Halorubrum sp. DTA98]|uniref:ArgE/DapE family deacylase n=1 Tax=Halorubrum sp. DTA98 TaxID=3402163 RepID=UPI003AB037C3